MPAKGSRITHCSRGHRYTDETMYIAPNGKRYCRPCMRIRNREYEKTRPRRPAPQYKRKPCEKCGGEKPQGALENTEWMEKAMKYLQPNNCQPVLSKVGGIDG